MGDFAVLGEDLANSLVKAGFELIETKQGKFITVYYFNDSEEFRAALDEIMLK